MAVKRLTLREQFERGDDTVLNADSSPERRLLEGIALAKATGAIIRNLGGSVAVTGELKVTTVQLEAFKALPINWPSLKEILTQAPAQTIAGAIAGGSDQKLNPGSDGVSLSGTVQLDDLIVAYLLSGYMLEKAQPVAAAFATTVGTIAAEAAPG